MEITICCGKGGVGKTTVATSLACCLASRGKSVAIIDWDGGHSVCRTLGLLRPVTPNILRPDLGGKNLAVCVVDGDDYKGIVEWKESGGELSGYLGQFSKDTGLVPIADMINAFFGVPTDPSVVLKLGYLIIALEEAREAGMEQVVIDVEPTAGLSRLLSTIKMTTKCLRNLGGPGGFALKAVVGMKWGDLAGYLRGEYISQASFYSERLERAAADLVTARYLLVCTPEAGPVEQLEQVERLIQKFGGRAAGYVVNNVRHEPHEAQAIAVVNQRRLPVVQLRHETGFHSNGVNRQDLLLAIGTQVATAFSV